MQIFFSQTIDASGNILLDAEESRHCLRVLRMRVGDKADVADGRGNFYHAEIISDKEKLCTLRILEHKKYFGKRDYSVSIGIALTKNIDRFEWFLEKSTEIGVDNIYPLLTERSERTRLNTERLRKILSSAMKQSGKAYLPVLHEPRNFQDILHSGIMTDLQKFICVCTGERQHLKNVCRKKTDALVLIGPEGDFTTPEISQAAANGFQAVSLGNSRLRVETAGVAACHIVNLVND